MYCASTEATGELLRRIGVNISLSSTYRNEEGWENAKIWRSDYKGLFLRLDVEEIRESMRDLGEKVNRLKENVGN